jgi:hypothetical protein
MGTRHGDLPLQLSSANCSIRRMTSLSIPLYRLFPPNNFI